MWNIMTSSTVWYSTQSFIEMVTAPSPINLNTETHLALLKKKCKLCNKGDLFWFILFCRFNLHRTIHAHSTGKSWRIWGNNYLQKKEIIINFFLIFAHSTATVASFQSLMLVTVHASFLVMTYWTQNYCSSLWSLSMFGQWWLILLLVWWC